MSGFARSQIKKLARALDPARIQVREARGQQLRYVEGWFAIQEANAIFGFAGWDRQMVHFEKLYERPRGNATTLAYCARVRIRVRAGEDLVVREGTGFGSACEVDLAEAHERALKAAETDATKRALSTFGNRFGLSLYDKEQNGGQPAHQFSLHGADGALIARSVSPEAFCSGLRQLVDAGACANDLIALRLHNQAMIEALRREAPSLRSPRGIHYADILQSLIAKRLVTFEAKGRPEVANTASAEDSAAQTPSAALIDAQIPSTNGLDPVGGRGQDSGIDAEPGTVPANQDQVLARTESRPPQSQQDGSPLSQTHDNLVSSKHLPATTRPSRIGFGQAVEKSQLQLSSERRVRNKAHLAFVASKPCLICEDLPCHAHHVTFAQRRGLSQKVGDEFTVPLCVLHHNAVHLSGPERAWWRSQGIEPFEAAAKLWAETLAGSHALSTE